MQRRSVLLPEPELPIMEITSPLCADERDALEHLERAERLVEVGDHQRRRRSGCLIHGVAPRGCDRGTLAAPRSTGKRRAASSALKSLFTMMAQALVAMPQDALGVCPGLLAARDGVR